MANKIGNRKANDGSAYLRAQAEARRRAEEMRRRAEEARLREQQRQARAQAEAKARQAELAKDRFEAAKKSTAAQALGADKRAASRPSTSSAAAQALGADKASASRPTTSSTASQALAAEKNAARGSGDAAAPLAKGTSTEAPPYDGPIAPTPPAIAKVEEAIAAVEDAEGGDRKEATVEALDTLREELAAETDPAARARAVEALQPSLATLYAEVPKLDAEQTVDAIEDLSVAAELLPADAVDAFTATFATNFPVPARQDDWGSNGTELTEAIEAAVANGHGASFARSVAANFRADGEEALASHVEQAAARGVATLREDFEAAEEAYAAVEAEIAGFLYEYGDTLAPDQRDEAIQAVLDRHSGVVEDFEAAAGEYASAIEGLVTIPEGADEEGAALTIQLREEAAKLRENLGRITDTTAGKEIVASAVREAGEGTSTWVNAATITNAAITAADGIADAVVKSVTAEVSKLVSTGKYSAAADLFEGIKNGGPFLGVSDPDALDGLITRLRNQARNPASLDVFARGFAEEVGRVDGQFARNGTGTGVERGIGVLGLVVSATALYSNIDDLGTADAETAFRFAVQAADTSGAIAALLGRSGGGLVSFAALGQAGIALSAVDAYRAARDGDYASAGLATASVVSGILTTTSLGGPAGTAVGAVLAVATVAGGFLLGKFREGQAEDAAEADLGAFLQAGGFTERQAEILRDVTKSEHRSIGRIFSQIAEELNVSPRTAALWFLSESDTPGFHEDLVNRIEDFERDDDGNYSQEAVERAIELISAEFGHPRAGASPDSIESDEPGHPRNGYSADAAAAVAG